MESYWDKAFDEVDESFPEIDINESLGDLAPVATVAPPKVEELLQTDPPSLDLMSLLEIGSLTEDFEFNGNKIRIKTLTIGEELEVALLIKKYQETIDEDKAYATAIVAASIVTVNGSPLASALGPGEDLLARKFDYISSHWYWVSILAIYKKYSDLASRVYASLDEIKKN